MPEATVRRPLLLTAALSAAVLVCCLSAPAISAAQSPSEYQYGAPNLEIAQEVQAQAAEPEEPPPPPAEESNPERSSLAAAIPAPGELELSAETVSEGGLLTLLMVALLYLPVMIFNKTTEKNHAVISGWLQRPREWFAWLTGLIPFFRYQLGTLAVGVLATTALFAFVEPQFPAEEGALEYLIGLLAGFTLVSATFFCTWRAVVHRLEPDATGHWVIYGPYVILAGFLVVMARLAHFLPGVVLGTVAEYEPKTALSTRTAGIRVATTYGALMALGLIAWLAWSPVKEAADEPGAGSLILILDAMLAITFVSALETVVFGLIPMTFLDGEELFRWKLPLWAAMWGASLLWFVMVVLHPALGTYHAVEGGHVFWVFLMLSTLMILALSTWAYFRLREARGYDEPVTAATSPSNPG